MNKTSDAHANDNAELSEIVACLHRMERVAVACRRWLIVIFALLVVVLLTLTTGPVLLPWLVSVLM